MAACGREERGAGYGSCWWPSTLIDEDQSFGFQIELIIERVVPLLQDVGTALLDGMTGPFDKVGICFFELDAAAHVETKACHGY